MIAVFAALDRELAPLRRQRPQLRAEQAPGRGALLWAQPGLLLVRTGMGGPAAREAADAILAGHQIRAALSIGLAGALRGSLEPGEVVLCERVLPWPGHQDGRAGAAATSAGVPKVGDEAVECDRALLVLAEECARAARVSYRRGQSLTYPEMVRQPQTKALLGSQCGADAVEMESAWIGRAAHAKGVPFLAVRAITDGVRESLPPLSPGAVASNWLAAAWLATHPWEAPRAARLARQVWKAQRNLALLVGLLLLRLGAGEPLRTTT